MHLFTPDYSPNPLITDLSFYKTDNGIRLVMHVDGHLKSEHLSWDQISDMLLEMKCIDRIKDGKMWAQHIVKNVQFDGSIIELKCWVLIHPCDVEITDSLCLRLATMLEDKRVHSLTGIVRRCSEVVAEELNKLRQDFAVFTHNLKCI